MRPVKFSAMNAAWGPYCMSWGISERMIASVMINPAFEFNIQKYGKAKRAVATTPMRYIRRRPMTSDRYPKKGKRKSESTGASNTAMSEKVRATWQGATAQTSTNALKKQEGACSSTRLRPEGI